MMWYVTDMRVPAAAQTRARFARRSIIYDIAMAAVEVSALVEARAMSRSRSRSSCRLIANAVVRDRRFPGRGCLREG
jgi:hypothetical protein